MRNQKLKEEKEAQAKSSKKGACTGLPLICTHLPLFSSHTSPHPTASAKAKPTLKGNVDDDLDDVRYATTAMDDEYDFMVCGASAVAHVLWRECCANPTLHLDARSDDTRRHNTRRADAVCVEHSTQLLS